MSTPAVRPEPLIGRCYTKARRHRNVVGNWPGGGRIWGGPYTWPQIFVALAAIAVLLLSRGVWAHHGVLDLLPLLGVPYALALVVGRIHVDGRNPLSVAASALGLAVSGNSGRLGGRPVRRPRRGAAVGLCTLTWQPANGAGSANARPEAVPALPKLVRIVPAPGAPKIASATGRPVADVPVVRVASGVGALLAARAADPAATTNSNERGR
ncbi:hypothetical protein [Streptomyces yunnanensis]|uniref:Uncharacterized protein n=1 Tax=Streptomyces yunnanensis TaxID=156453 RepID=A0A9X8R062_9ACTN|nr:hypothetical protein [Streptomyces yunnanensis]SHN31100.1 hypothetical protein SAMN05216268_13351 [Streptomyces yunnanensis]